MAAFCKKLNLFLRYDRLDELVSLPSHPSLHSERRADPLVSYGFLMKEGRLPEGSRRLRVRTLASTRSLFLKEASPLAAFCKKLNLFVRLPSERARGEAFRRKRRKRRKRRTPFPKAVRPPEGREKVASFGNLWRFLKQVQKGRTPELLSERASFASFAF